MSLLAPGTTVARYTILGRLATGGMSEVYLARQAGPSGFTKVLVLKIILPQLASDQQFVQMFHNEAKLAALINHPNVVQIFDFGVEDSLHYMAMEYIDGRNLNRILKALAKTRQFLPVPIALRIVSDAAGALEHAHSLCDSNGECLQIIHRDVSLENILCTYTGQVKLVDFGIAKARTLESYTTQGVLKGKYNYMAPELIDGLPIDHRIDIYALGVVLYRLITGQLPFAGDSHAQILHRIMNWPPTPPHELRPDLDSDLERIIMQTLAKDRELRFQRAAELQAEIETYLQHAGVNVMPYQLSQFMNATFPPGSDEDRENYQHLASGGTPRTPSDGQPSTPSGTPRPGATPLGTPRPSTTPVPTGPRPPAPRSAPTGPRAPAPPRAAQTGPRPVPAASARDATLKTPALVDAPPALATTGPLLQLHTGEPTVGGLKLRGADGTEAAGEADDTQIYDSPSSHFPDDGQAPPLPDPITQSRTQETVLPPSTPPPTLPDLDLLELPARSRGRALLIVGSLVFVVAALGAMFLLLRHSRRGGGGATTTVDAARLATRPADATPAATEASGAVAGSRAADSGGAVVDRPAPKVAVAKSKVAVPASKVPVPSSKNKGSISVQSLAPAEVLIEGKRVGVVPLSELSWPAGNYRLTVRSTQHRYAIYRNITVEPGGVTDLRLVPRKGELRVLVRPWAVVSVDGQRLGTTPLPSTSLYEGPHQLELENSNLNVQRKMKVIVKPGKEEVVKVHLD